MSIDDNLTPAQPPTLFSYFKGSGRLGLIGAGIAFLISAIPVIYGGVLSKTTFEARRAVEFIFEGIEEKRYPSGLPFAIQDVITPVVLMRSYQQLGLESVGIQYSDFRNAIRIEPYAETYDDRAKAYRTRLGVEALEGPDIELIEEQMRADLATLYNRSARLSLALKEYGNLSEELLDQILVAVMENWARHAVEERGALNLPNLSGQSFVVDPAILEGLSFPLVEDYLEKGVLRVQTRVGTLLEVPGAASLLAETELGSVSFNDLMSRVEEISTFAVGPLINRLVSTGKAADWASAQYFFDQEVQRIELTIEELTAKAQNLGDANQQYINLDRNLRPAQGGIVRAEGVTDSIAGDYITLGDGFAERVFDIAETTDRHGFVQRNLSNRVATLDEIASLRRRLQRIRAFQQRAAAAGNPSYSPQDTMALNSLARDLNAVWRGITALEKKVAAQKNWLPGQLYNLVGEKESYSVYQPLWGTRNIALVIVLTILGAMCGIFTAVLRKLSKS